MYFPLNFVNSHFLSYNLIPLHSNPRPITNLPLPVLDSWFSFLHNHIQAYIKDV